MTLSSEDPEFKYLAQKCFVSYFKSVWLQVWPPAPPLKQRGVTALILHENLVLRR